MKSKQPKQLVDKGFQKGNNRNPKGRPKETTAKKALRKLTQRQIEEIGKHIITGSLQDIAILRDKEKRQTLPLIDAMVLSIVARIVSKGDAKAFNNLLDRLVGTVKQSVHVTGDGSTAPQVIITMPDNGRKQPAPKK